MSTRGNCKSPQGTVLDLSRHKPEKHNKVTPKRYLVVFFALYRKISQNPAFAEFCTYLTMSASYLAKVIRNVFYRVAGIQRRIVNQANGGIGKGFA